MRITRAQVFALLAIVTPIATLVATQVVADLVASWAGEPWDEGDTDAYVVGSTAAFVTSSAFVGFATLALFYARPDAPRAAAARRWLLGLLGVLFALTGCVSTALVLIRGPNALLPYIVSTALVLIRGPNALLPYIAWLPFGILLLRGTFTDAATRGLRKARSDVTFARTFLSSLSALWRRPD